MRWMVRATLRPLYSRERDPVPIVYEAGCAPGSIWTVAENLVPTGIRSPDRPARSQSLYRPSYPGPPCCITKYKSILQLVNTTLYSGRIAHTLGLNCLAIIRPNNKNTKGDVCYNCNPEIHL